MKGEAFKYGQRYSVYNKKGEYRFSGMIMNVNQGHVNISIPFRLSSLKFAKKTAENNLKKGLWKKEKK